VEGYRSIWKFLFGTSFRHDWIDVNGVRTRFLEAGRRDAPPVILLHGTAGTLENFSPNIAEYAKHFHVFAIDMVGCGFTAKPDYPYEIPVYVDHVRGFIDVMGITRTSFVGVSLGSWISARFAVTYRGRVEKIVMIAPAGIITDPVVFKQVADGIRARRTRGVEDPSWDNIKRILENLMLDPKNVIDDLVAVRLAAYQRPEMKAAMPHALAMLSGDNSLSENEWRELDTPILVIDAIDHPDMFLTNGRRIVELAPRARAVQIPGCNHWAQFENAAAFNKASIEFLRETPME